MIVVAVYIVHFYFIRKVSSLCLKQDGKINQRFLSSLSAIKVEGPNGFKCNQGKYRFILQ
jgi:hypothetical protein